MKRALVVIGLVVLIIGLSGCDNEIKDPTCDVGFLMLEGECVKEVTSCNEGYEVVENVCKAIECEEYHEYVDGACTRTSCPEGEFYVEGECSDQPVCTENEIYNQMLNQCVALPPSCLEEEFLVDGECIDEDAVIKLFVDKYNQFFEQKSTYDVLMVEVATEITAVEFGMKNRTRISASMIVDYESQMIVQSIIMNDFGISMKEKFTIEENRYVVEFLQDEVYFKEFTADVNIDHQLDYELDRTNRNSYLPSDIVSIDYQSEYEYIIEVRFEQSYLKEEFPFSEYEGTITISVDFATNGITLEEMIVAPKEIIEELGFEGYIEITTYTFMDDFNFIEFNPKDYNVYMAFGIDQTATNLSSDITYQLQTFNGDNYVRYYLEPGTYAVTGDWGLNNITFYDSNYDEIAFTEHLVVTEEMYVILKYTDYTHGNLYSVSLTLVE